MPNVKRSVGIGIKITIKRSKNKTLLFAIKSTKCTCTYLNCNFKFLVWKYTSAISRLVLLANAGAFNASTPTLAALTDVELCI